MVNIADTFFLRIKAPPNNNYEKKSTLVSKTFFAPPLQSRKCKENIRDALGKNVYVEKLFQKNNSPLLQNSKYFCESLQV